MFNFLRPLKTRAALQAALARETRAEAEIDALLWESLKLRTTAQEALQRAQKAERALDTMNVHLIDFARKYAERGTQIETLKRESFARLRIPSNEELEAGQW